MKKFSFLILLLCIFLSSCAIRARTYVEPKDGSVASINFINNGDGTSYVEFFREYETCKSRDLSDPIPLHQSKIFKVRAGSPVSFGFGYNFNDYRFYKFCKVYGTFTPVENTLYQAEISPFPDGCILKFTKLEGLSTSRDISFKQREVVKNPLDENSSFCQ